MTDFIPVQPAHSFRVTLNLIRPEKRIDNILLAALHNQSEHEKLKIISRGALKKLFSEGKVLIKGQRARSSSALARGVTYVDVLLK